MKYITSTALCSLLTILLAFTPTRVDAGIGDGHTILFLRGGPGSGGFLEGGADEQLSSIHDESTAQRNHGWGELAALLRAEGFELQEMREGAAGSSPVDLAGMDLTVYSVIVFGSNNADYGTVHVDAVQAYVEGGGGALFISDANWGMDWGDAPSSDQSFLDRFGWVMNQDHGTYTLSGTDLVTKEHPLLDGVQAFDGEGVSPISIVDLSVPGVVTTRLAQAEGNVRRNTTSGRGPTTGATADDCSLVVATVEAGKIAGHFDRNTFFNRNGAGSNIHKNDNSQLALNLFAWLAERRAVSSFRRSDVDGDGSLSVSDAVQTLSVLFRPDAVVEQPTCLDALDGNDDGLVDISDGVFVLFYLFRDGFPPPAAPFPECGVDSTMDKLTCASYEGCTSP